MSDAFFRDSIFRNPTLISALAPAPMRHKPRAVMERFEPVVLAKKPDWVLVVGDVNSTLACALVCVKLGIKVAHVEAGLAQSRSHDARRDQPPPDRPDRRLAVYAIARRG